MAGETDAKWIEKWSRLQPYVEACLGEYEFGFRRGRLTTDQIFVLRQILEKNKEHNIDTYHLFIDYKTAYDSVLIPKLHEAMNKLRTPEKLISLVNMTMFRLTSSVKIVV